MPSNLLSEIFETRYFGSTRCIVLYIVVVICKVFPPNAGCWPSNICKGKNYLKFILLESIKLNVNFFGLRYLIHPIALNLKMALERFHDVLNRQSDHYVKI